MTPKFKNILLSSALVLALVLSLGLIVYLQQKLFSFTVENTNSGTTITNLNYDPFVVTVPKEYVDLQARSKIYINTVDPYQGNLGAPVVLVSFLSFADPKSQAVYQTIKQLSEKYPEQLVWFWKDYPISDQAKTLAVAAQCAGNEHKFSATAEQLFNNPEDTSSTENYQACINSKEMLDIVNSNYYYGRSVEVKAAPTLFINDKKYTENLTLENLAEVIQNEINSKN